RKALTARGLMTPVMGRIGKLRVSDGGIDVLVAALEIEEHTFDMLERALRAWDAEAQSWTPAERFLAWSARMVASLHGREPPPEWHAVEVTFTARWIQSATRVREPERFECWAEAGLGGPGLETRIGPGDVGRLAEILDCEERLFAGGDLAAAMDHAGAWLARVESEGGVRGEAPDRRPGRMRAWNALPLVPVALAELAECVASAIACSARAELDPLVWLYALDRSGRIDRCVLSASADAALWAARVLCNPDVAPGDARPPPEARRISWLDATPGGPDPTAPIASAPKLLSGTARGASGRTAWLEGLSYDGSIARAHITEEVIVMDITYGEEVYSVRLAGRRGARWHGSWSTRDGSRGMCSADRFDADEGCVLLGRWRQDHDYDWIVQLDFESGGGSA
ncbi:MAG: hypothetical protein WCJ30_24330, partial [Deltaproteobacteria bacterium]